MPTTGRTKRKIYHERVEVDFWTRIANHLLHFAHPAPALEGKELIAWTLSSSPRARARRISRRSRPATPPVPQR